MEVEILNRDIKKDRNKKRKLHISLLKKGCFVNKTTQTSLATSSTSNSSINVGINKCSKASISEEEDIKCSIKSHVETVNEEMKGSGIEVDEIEIRKCSRRSRAKIINY